ncbi:MAG: hypothetical protein E8D46_01980 [Nitrospira sp.]|nr:hypothetical protein [Nitrospira sp.]TKB75615.1 MAG: hypothetical protein E8D46_01980 [Nitrospira sp.]
MAALLLRSQRRLFRSTNGHDQAFQKPSMPAIASKRGEPENHSLYVFFLGRREEEEDIEDSSSLLKQTSPKTAYRYRESFGWRFGSKPLSLLLIGLLDSPSERMSSIWDSLQVRSPSAAFRG